MRVHDTLAPEPPWPDDDVAVRAERRGDAIVILSFRCGWDGHTPTPVWKEVALLDDPTDGEIAAALRDAERRRRRSLRACADCGERVAPERGSMIHGAFRCHGCMERHHGVVF